MRVVIAEDEALIRLDLRDMLEEAGHEVVGEARNGLEAVEAVRRLQPDVVFMDINMPQMDGTEATEIISGERLAPVIMLTAFSQATYVKRACRAGAMAYVSKPFSPGDVLPAMQVAVSRFTEATVLAEEVTELEDRLETRKVVDRAKGALMARGLSESEAFRRIQRVAMDSRKSLREIAEAVILADQAAE